MEFRSGPEFSQAGVEEVRAYLNYRRLKKYVLPPDRLHVVNDGSELFLRVSNGKTEEYPVRGSFLFKLLKWYSFPVRQVRRLSIDTLTSILNDYLLAIPGGEVNVTIEDGEALALTSRRYNELSDLEVLEKGTAIGMETVSRNDYFMRLYGRTDFEVSPRPGDVCGLGYNVFNSETGFSALAIRLFIRRYVCSNGAVVGYDSRGTRVHYGHPDMELSRFLDVQLKEAENQRGEAADLLVRSTQISAAPEIEATAKRLRMIVGKKRTDELIDGLGEGPTVYDLANAVTSMAQTLDIRRRLQAEAIGGDLLAPLPAQGTVDVDESHEALIGG